ncbi:MAG: tRNA (N6-threonylcarbamoyladenosine(37)-N6)-methyltransferase TrmO [Sphaerobacter sp.]|nr:tRNA (N6-threonylcarbamoyladenosine(37)-N6)-methyltransferase TrmO [Sphaerobacter sp.]
MAFDLVQIGVVHSLVSDRRLMPRTGVPAEIHIFPEYADGLLLIEENSHIWVIGWLEDADREHLQIVRPTYEPSRRRRGVFGLRSPTRPNPLSLTATRLLAVEGNVLQVERLDLVDGTPVLDLKRYSPSWDAIVAARSSRDHYRLDPTDAALVEEKEEAAVHFHGERCAAMVLGARLILSLALAWDIPPKDPELRVTVGTDAAVLHLADAVQALTAATFGTGRLRAAPGANVIFEHGLRRLIASPLPVDGMDLDRLRQVPLAHLFMLVEE